MTSGFLGDDPTVVSNAAARPLTLSTRTSATTAGSLSLVLDIQANGDLSEAHVDKSDPSLGSQVVTCVAQSAQRAHFAAVDAGTVKVRVGLAFTRPAADAGPEPGGVRGYILE